MSRLIVCENRRVIVSFFLQRRRECEREREWFLPCWISNSGWQGDVRWTHPGQMSVFNGVCKLTCQFHISWRATLCHDSLQWTKMGRRKSLNVRRGGASNLPGADPLVCHTAQPHQATPRYRCNFCHFWLQLILFISTVMCLVAPSKSVLWFNTEQSWLPIGHINYLCFRLQILALILCSATHLCLTTGYSNLSFSYTTVTLIDEISLMT